MHLQLRPELDLEAYLEPSVIALSDGSVHAFNRAASQLLDPANSISSLLDLCASRVDALRTYLLACSGSRQPLIEPVSFDGPDGTVDYRCFGNVLTPDAEAARPRSFCACFQCSIHGFPRPRSG